MWKVFGKLNCLLHWQTVEALAFNEIETVVETYWELRKRIVIAEPAKLVTITKRNGESSGDFLARLKKK